MGLFSASPSTHHGHSSSSTRPSYPRSSSNHSRASSSHINGHSHSSQPHSTTYTRSSGTSSYRRRPRAGYIAALFHKLKHLLRELFTYARRNPAKLFFLVIMPLISGGVLAGLARALGIRLPAFLMGKGAAARGSGGYYGSAGYDEGGGMAEGLGSVMKIAKMFI